MSEGKDFIQSIDSLFHGYLRKTIKNQKNYPMAPHCFRKNRKLTNVSINQTSGIHWVGVGKGRGRERKRKKEGEGKGKGDY